jgi:hypothetical protein
VKYSTELPKSEFGGKKAVRAAQEELGMDTGALINALQPLVCIPFKKNQK